METLTQNKIDKVVTAESLTSIDEYGFIRMDQLLSLLKKPNTSLYAWSRDQAYNYDNDNFNPYRGGLFPITKKRFFQNHGNGYNGIMVQVHIISSYAEKQIKIFLN